MKRSKKIALIAALVCVAAGAVISCCALASVRFDFERVNTMKFETKTYDVRESFSNIRIQGTECSVRLLPSRDGACTVVCTEGENIAHTVAVERDTLTITRTDSRKWYQRIGVYWGEMSVTVYLPAPTYGELFIQNASGDISVPGGFTFSQAQLQSTSGEIDCAAEIQGSLDLKTTSGDISASGHTAGALAVQSTSGDVELSGVQALRLTVETTSGEVTARAAAAAGDARVKTVSGEIDLERLSAQALCVRSTSGDVELADTVIAGALEIETVSGEIDLERCDGESLRIKSTSGDVSGTLLTSKRFTTQTTSGTVQVPNTASPGDGSCEVITTSGDIRFRTAG